MKLQPIHELPADELQHTFDIIRERIEFIYTHPETKPKKTRESIIRQIQINLNTIAESIKESLVFLFPKFDELINEILDTNDAIQAMSWARGYYPLREGVEALKKLYMVLNDYKTPNDFRKMEMAIKDYILITHHYFYDLQRKSRSSNGGKHPKRQSGILDSVIMLIIGEKQGYSAERLWAFFEKKHKGVKNSYKFNGFEIYFDYKDTNSDEERLFQISKDGTVKSIGRSAFNGYVKKAKESLK